MTNIQSGVFSADIGTSSLKAAVIAEDGTVLRFTRIFFPKEVKAAYWIRAFFSAWSTLTAGYRIHAICISGNGPSLVARSRHQCTVNTIYNHTVCSSGTDSSLFEKLIENAEKDTLLLWNIPVPDSAAGSIIPSKSLFLPRLAAFQVLYPDIFSEASYIFSGPEYLMYILTGNAVTVLPDPRYEIAYWNKESLYSYADSILHIPPETVTQLLPPFVKAGTVQGYFCGIPVVAGVPDFIAALIGTGTLAPGKACDRAGSSEGINLCLEQQLYTTGTLSLPSILPHFWNLSFLVPDSGTSFSGFLHSYGFSNSDYTKCMEQIAAEPFLSSGAYPATFAGNGRHFIETLAFRIRYGCDLLEQTAGVKPIYTLSGGQARNALWCQLKADITGRIFALPHFADAELLGNAALAFCALETEQRKKSRTQSLMEYSSRLTAAAQRLLHIDRYYEPNPDYTFRYAEKYMETYKRQYA